MNTKELRDLYDTLLDTGELYEVMPNALGIWEKDKTSFKNIQEEFDDIILHSDFNSTSLINDLSYEDDDDNGSSSFEPTEIDIPRFLQNKNF